jgi:hypothetical protein
MNQVNRDIFKAIHNGKWLAIEYKNKNDKVTKYWIGIHKLDIKNRTLQVDGLHLTEYTLKFYNRIYIDSIISTKIVEGTYQKTNSILIEDIYHNPHKYKALFDNVANLKILNYLEDCNRMDVTPYKTDFDLVQYLDHDSFTDEVYPLNMEQFQEIVKSFQIKTKSEISGQIKPKIQQLCMNVLSINTTKGLYVLAYRKLDIDVKNMWLKPETEITICTEFTIANKVESIRKFLDAEDYELLRDFKKNQERIKDQIQKNRSYCLGVDDMPYIIGLGMEPALDLHKEYQAIIEQYHKNETTIPLKAFFGDLTTRPIRTKTHTIALLNDKVNLDQLLAINNAMKYPLAYIQGPPGTGKTATIINTISTAFFNNKKVLFSSYNNHPIDSVFERLIKVNYQGKYIPFPIVRLGNLEKVKAALKYMKALYLRTVPLKIFKNTLDRTKNERVMREKKLSALLKKYEERLDLEERLETISRLLEYNREMVNSMQMLPYQADLAGQSYKIEMRLKEMGEVDEQEVMELVQMEQEELKKYLYYTSAEYIKRIDKPKNKELKEILFLEQEEDRVKQFNQYLSQQVNVEKFIQIFPVIVTTCISAHRIGEPKSIFDMVIMDEASQCNTAISLIAIIRGKNLMLVGDPQQLRPVILLDDLKNEKLRKKYMVTEEYDYCHNSIYKTFLACDAVSDEILLHYHYRCNEKIIQFNNKKYYNSKLSIRSTSNEREPLVYYDMEDSGCIQKNTAPAEAEQILKYAMQNKDKTIGVITPFVNQKKEIEWQLQAKQLNHVTCGTVHAFQGDEKDVVLFSTAITDNTFTGTYDWLKNNKELLNVATSRAKNKLIVLSNTKNLERLHSDADSDDLYELISYVKSNGTSHITKKSSTSRALGVKPFSTATEVAFLASLNHALENIWLSQYKFTVKKEVGIAHVFSNNISQDDLFYSGRFDFVVYEKHGSQEIPVLAIELDGKEHYEDEMVKARDRKKNEICRLHNMELIRIENTYARRYHHIKDILIQYFKKI